MWCTQIGGKYHPDDDTIFRLKQSLSRLGVSVSHPIADEIKTFVDGQGFAFDPTVLTFTQVEHDYYDSIKESEFHVVANQFETHLGYLGGSASLEMAYAMCQRRPIVLLHQASFSTRVEDTVREFLQPRLCQVVVHNFLTAPPESSIALIAAIGGRSVDYDVSSQGKILIESRVRALLEGIQLKVTDVAP
ncbi:MAG: hypothetical protein ACRDTG_07240 [Pseudonocardiaceae bacterium]